MTTYSVGQYAIRQYFVSWIINMHANGCNAALTGLVIAGFMELTSDVKMTPNEES